MSESSIDYEQAVGILSSLDVGSKEVVINPVDALAQKIEVKPFDYMQANSLISFAGGMRVEAPRPQQAIPSAVPAPGGGRIAQMPAAASKEETEAYNAASEIKEMVSSIDKEAKKEIVVESAKIGKSTLILPGLSLQDQISDLEKISEGLDEKVFNGEQQGIILDEITGLGEKLKYGKKETLDPFQMSLTGLRDQRLDDVKRKMKSYKPKAASQAGKKK